MPTGAFAPETNVLLQDTDMGRLCHEQPSHQDQLDLKRVLGKRHLASSECLAASERLVS